MAHPPALLRRSPTPVAPAWETRVDTCLEGLMDSFPWGI